MSGNYEIDGVRKLESDVGVLELELLNGKCVLERERDWDTHAGSLVNVLQPFIC